MIQYQVLLTCEDDEVHLTRGMRVEEDQLAPEKLQRWIKLGAIAQIEANPTMAAGDSWVNP